MTEITKAEIRLASDLHVLINRCGRGYKTYYPTAASWGRLFKILDRCPQMVDGQYYYRDYEFPGRKASRES